MTLGGGANSPLTDNDGTLAFEEALSCAFMFFHALTL